MGTLRISVGETHVCSWDACRGGRDHRGSASAWKPPTYIGFQAPVPAPPDYSTPAKVTARCWEGGFGRPFTAKAASDKSFGKLYKAFRAVVPAMPCPVADTHQSRFEVVTAHHEGGQAIGWTMVEKKPEAPKPEPKARKARKAA